MSGAAVAAVMLFAVATAPESRLFPGPQSPFIASAARRAVPPVDENRGLSDAEYSTTDARQTDPQFPGWARVKRQVSDPAPNPDGDPPITGHMR